MAFWEWRGVKYEALDPDDWTIRVLKEVEKNLGCTYGEATGADRYLAIAWGVLRCGGAQITWDELQDELTGRDVSKLVTALYADSDPQDVAGASGAAGDKDEGKQPVEVTGTLQISPEVLSPTNAGSDS